MEKERAQRVVEIMDRLDRLNKEKADLEYSRTIFLSRSEFSHREKIDYLANLMKRDEKTLILFLESFEEIMDRVVGNKQKEIEDVEKELESL